MPHPQEEQLLRYSDGELPSRVSSQVRSHLEACWQCRTNLEELENTVGACVRYRASVLQRHLPAPPAPWTDIYGSFAEIDASLARPSLVDRFSRMLSWPLHHPKQWIPAAVALLLIFGLFYRYRLTPSVQAAELLHKAIAAADAHAAKPQLIRVRTKERSFTRRAGSAQALASNSADRETLSSLQTLFHNANYNWDDPLSARSYSAWRDQLSAKRDQVKQERDSFRVVTDTESGDLLEATLQLRSQDLQPMEGRFEFRNQDWVEITAMSEDIEPSASLIAPPNGPTPENRIPSALEPTPNNVAPIVHAATVGDELHVWSALHEVGADLGDPLEVSRNADEVLVSGVGIAPERQQEIQQALSSLPNVVVRFSEAAPPGPLTQPAQPQNPATGDNRQLRARIAEQVGGRANFDQLAAQILDMSDPMMSRAYALRRLVERFPIPVETQLGSQDLETLRRLQREHTAALRQQVLELERVLKPALKSAGGAGLGTSGPALSSDTLQGAAEELFQSARRVERLLAVMFGSAAGDTLEDQLPAQLLSDVAQLRAKVEAYDGLLAKSER